MTEEEAAQDAERRLAQDEWAALRRMGATMEDLTRAFQTMIPAFQAIGKTVAEFTEALEEVHVVEAKARDAERRLRGIPGRATGEDLDMLALRVGLHRTLGETDAEFRRRIEMGLSLSP